jgi:hypothetical protein
MWWNEEIDIIDLIGGMKERLIDAAGFARMVGDKSDELRAYYPAAVEFFNVYEAALRDAGAIGGGPPVRLGDRWSRPIRVGESSLHRAAFNGRNRRPVFRLHGLRSPPR